jgi:hypothetical protein
VAKTTVEINDGVLAAAKERAARERTTLREVVETALRAYGRGGTPRSDFRLRDAAVGGRGLRPEFAGRPFGDVVDAAYGEPA